MNDYEVLLILGRLDKYIVSLSRKIFLPSLDYSFDDLVQEGKLKVLQVIDQYYDYCHRDIVAICVQALGNLYKGFIRKEKSYKYEGVMVDLDEAFALADKDALCTLYTDCAMSYLRQLCTDEELLVLNTILNPPVDLIEQVCRESSNDVGVKMSRPMLSEYLHLKRGKLSRILKGIREKVDQSLELLPIT